MKSAQDLHRRRYDAFLSYSHAADGRLAPAVQLGLHQLAKRWNEVRALRVFRDQISLSANPDLWLTISEALRESRYFILMASPEAADSPWVEREINYWRSNRERDRFLIVLTSGEIVWDDVAGDFDWEQTTALPSTLRGWFSAEPLWVDLSWARDQDQLSVRHSRFRSDIATLAAPIHGTARDELDSEDVHRYRVSTRVRRGLVSGLAVFLVAAVVLGVVTWIQQSAAVEQRDRALSRELAARSEVIGDSDPELARLLSLAAARISPTGEALASMLTAAARPGIARLVADSRVVHSVAFSPDGRTLATGGGTTVRLWDVASRRQRGDTLPGQPTAAKVVTFSPDGGTLAVSSVDGMVRLWDTGTHRPVGTPMASVSDSPYGPARGTALSLAYSPDGTTVALGGGDGAVRLWHLGSRQQVGNPLRARAMSQADSPSPSVAFSPDGRTIATSANDGTIRFWDVGTRRQVGVPVAAYPEDPAAGVVATVVFSPDGTVVASAGVDGTIRLWDSSTHTPTGSPLIGYTRVDRVTTSPSIAFSRDGRTIAAGSQDGTIRLWDLTTRQQIGAPLSGHTQPVTSLAFSPDNRTMASGARDGTLRLWGVGGQLDTANPMTGSPAAVYSAAFSPDGKTLATGGDYGGNLDDLGRQFACPHRGWGVCVAGNGWIATLAVDPDPEAMTRVIAGTDIFQRQRRIVDGATVTLWDTTRRTAIGRLYTGDTRTVRTVAFSPDGTILAVGGAQAGPRVDAVGTVTLWDVATRKQTAGFTTGRYRPVRTVAFSPDGKTLAVANDGEKQSSEPTVSLWSVDDKRQTVVLLAGETAYTLAFSPDGGTVVAGRADGVVHLWDRGSPGRPVTLPAGHTGPVGSVAFSPAGDLLATAGDDGTIRLWDVATRQPLGAPLTGHTGPVYSVAFSPDGRVLASTSGDHSVRLWDLAARRQISQPYLAHHLPGRAVAFSPDGRALVSVAEDHAVRMWAVDRVGDVESALCATAGRSLTPQEWARYIPDLPHRRLCP